MCGFGYFCIKCSGCHGITGQHLPTDNSPKAHSPRRVCMLNFAGLLVNNSMVATMPLLLAQYSSSSRTTSPTVSPLGILVQLILYAFIAYCTQTFLKKLDYQNSWYAWIPVVNTYALLEAGEQEQPLLWSLLTLIPCVGLISLIKIIPAYIRICERLNKPPAILWTFLICGLGALIVPAVLAFT
jgi:hypothetical protein